MLHSIIALSLLACTGSEAPTPAPEAVPVATEPPPPAENGMPAGFPDYTTTGAQSYQLHKLPGTYSLPKVKLGPRISSVTDTFTLPVEEVPNPKGAKRALKVIRAELPFPVSPDDQTFKPIGMQVFVGEEELIFARGPAPQAQRPTWRIKGKSLIMSYPEVPTEVRLVYPGVKALIDRHHPERSELSAEAFVHYDITLKGQTRQGLLLPAPASAEWEVKIPASGAIFESWLAMEQAPLEKPKSDGAKVVLSLIMNGEEVVVEARDLPGHTKDYERWRVDLGPWAGKDATLRVTTEAKENAAFDWVFLGSPAIWGDPTGEVRRVIVIGLDTTRPDHLSFYGYKRPTTPELDAFAEHSIVFDHAWNTAPRTRPSFRSATTGRIPLKAVGAKNIGEVFNEHGFATAGIVANVHLQPRFDFDDGFDAWHFDGRANADNQVDMALEWLNDNVQRDTYLFLHFMDPHMVYGAPGEWRDKFVKHPVKGLPPKLTRSQVLAMMKRGELTDEAKAELIGLHDGELAFTSHELGRLFEAVDQMPGRTLILLHSDHGEEFWDHGGFEHNHTLFDETTRAVLWMRPGGGLPAGRRISTLASPMDMGATLFELMGFEDTPEQDGRSLVPLMAGHPGGDPRPMPIAHIQYSHERWGVIWEGKKYILHTGSGLEELYDLERDPKEKKNIAADTDLSVWREKLKESHEIPVGPGWRVLVNLQGEPEPVEITLPAKAIMAGVLNPEATIEHRANIEWGELPQKLPQDVGEVTLSEDGLTMTYTPGPKPQGILYVLFDEAVPPGKAKVRVGGAAVTLNKAKKGPLYKQGNQTLQLSPGTVVVPGPTEADLMGIGPGAAGADEEMAMLCELGYVQCEDH